MRIDVEIIGADPRKVSKIVCEKLRIINLHDSDNDYFNRRVNDHFYFGARRGASGDERIDTGDTFLSFWFDVEFPFWRSIKELAEENQQWNWYVCVRAAYWDAVMEADSSRLVPIKIDAFKTVFAGLSDAQASPEYKKVPDTEAQMPPW